MAVRSEKTKQEFIKYMEDHPQERFWQCVSNFSGYGYIVASDFPPTAEGQIDTFHIEEKNHVSRG